MLKYIKGDITEIESGIICQQTNCQGVMGSGLAKAIRDKWPKVFDEYGIDIEFYNNRERDLDEIFPWDFISCGVNKEYLKKERYGNPDFMNKLL